MQDTIETTDMVFNISDPIEKLYELKLISWRTLNCLRSAIGWNGYDYDPNIAITLADIIYAPKMWLHCIPNMGDKSIGEIVSFMNNYPIQGRIIPTKEDIKRVLKNTNGISILEYPVTNLYFLEDRSVDDICKLLRMELYYLHMLIGRLLAHICKSAYRYNWGLLDLITLSSMIDLYSARRGTYRHRDYCLKYIAGRIRDLLLSKE